MGLLSCVLCDVVCEGQPVGDWSQEVMRGAEASGDLAVFYVVSKEGTEVKASGLQGFKKNLGYLNLPLKKETQTAWL